MNEFAASILLLIVSVIFKEDIKSLLPIVTRAIVRSAAKKLPHDLQGRYYEEWLAHSEELPTWFQRLTHATSLYCFGAPAIDRDRKNNFEKTRRILDILMLIIILPTVAPTFFIIFCMNRRDGGPACRIHRLRRDDGIEIQLYKFRTLELRPNGSVSRYRFGDFLRKTALDEIPLVLNILKGDISFIGKSIYQDDLENLANNTFGIVDAPCPAFTSHLQFAKWYIITIVCVPWNEFIRSLRA